MSRTIAERCGDVRRLVEAAGRVAGRDALVAQLVGSTGLSCEGVELGLDRHLELAPTDEEIAALVASAGDAKHVAVILSANVFVAALRAIAIARAASPSVVVRPSKREPHFARALVEAVEEPGLTLTAEVDFARLFGGEVHVYGRDATIAAVRARVG
ncbi:MAG TPA: proline dehydrogenase, partial [Polyangiaceae bacterium]